MAECGGGITAPPDRGNCGLDQLELPRFFYRIQPSHFVSYVSILSLKIR
jgi:hypothetical protein